MKKVLLTLMMCLSVALVSISCRGSSSGSGQGSHARVGYDNVVDIVKQNCHRSDGFNVIYVNKSMMSLFKLLAAFVSDDGDEDVKTALNACRNVKSLTLVEYDDADKNAVASLRTALTGCLDPDLLLFETRDNDDCVRIWATSVDKQGNMCDLVMDVDGECLICVKGKIDVAKLVNLAMN